MKSALIAVSLTLLAIPHASADEALALQIKSKSAIATAVPHRSAPYVQPVGESEREPLLSPRDLRQDQSRSSCEAKRDLCYDPTVGRVVYKPARAYMPDLPGLQPDSISVKRDKIVFKYTF